MSWLAPRKQDWLDCPPDVFDNDMLAFAQEKTSLPNVIPRRMAQPLVDRIEAAKARRRDDQRSAMDVVNSTKSFHDGLGRPWKDADDFRDAFNVLRDRLVAKHPFFPTSYYVGILPGNPLAIPTKRLTMRTLRHTCVTLYFDAGVPPHLIGGITGHSQDEVDEILAYYRARTADQAAAALTWRIEYEERMRTKKATSALAGAQDMSWGVQEL